jgi:hypothetical protein
MTDALVLCVRCMRFACSAPGKCGDATLLAPTGDASGALWMSFCEVFESPRPATSREAAQTDRPTAETP